MLAQAAFLEQVLMIKVENEDSIKEGRLSKHCSC
jgi:hypothetical protein